MRTEFLCISVLKVASGHRVKLVGCKNALTPPPPRPSPPPPWWFILLTALRRWSRCGSYSLLLCGLFYEAIPFLPYVILFLCSIAITSLWEERANLSSFRTFVRFALDWFCLFSLPLGFWEGLRLVIVPLPGLFCYLFVSQYNMSLSSFMTMEDIPE